MIDQAQKTKEHLRKFGIVMFVPLAGLGVFSLWRQNLWTGGVLAALGLIFLALGLFAPLSLRGVERVWMMLAERLGRVMTFVILTISFIVAFVPTGLVLKLFRKDLLKRKQDPNLASYWDKVELDGPTTRPDKPY